MATQPDKDDEFTFNFPDETVIDTGGKDVEEPEVEVIDDTPEEDRNRGKMPQEIVDELENDELDEYSEKVKIRLKQMKRVWHDERREKERVFREQQEAVAAAQRLLDENKRLRQTLSQGEGTLVATAKQAAELEAAQAKREYKEAYESGDSDRLVEAQDKLTNANYRLQQINNYRPTLQDEDFGVEIPQPQIQAPQIDPKTRAWQERNSWWGTDEEMTASALGLHQKLERERGPQYVGSDEYWSVIDTTMRRRFPEYFGEEEPPDRGPRTRSESRSAQVVAPASRSTSSKKVRLTASQVSIAKRLGITPEQYARELVKTEQ